MENSAVWTIGHGNRLKALRKARGFTLYKLSRKSDVEPSVIWKYESGMTRRPSADNLLRIAQALGTTVEHLLESAQGASKIDRKRTTPRAASAAGMG